MRLTSALAFTPLACSSLAHAAYLLATAPDGLSTPKPAHDGALNRRGPICLPSNPSHTRQRRFVKRQSNEGGQPNLDRQRSRSDNGRLNLDDEPPPAPADRLPQSSSHPESPRAPTPQTPLPDAQHERHVQFVTQYWHFHRPDRSDGLAEQQFHAAALAHLARAPHTAIPPPPPPAGAGPMARHLARIALDYWQCEGAPASSRSRGSLSERTSGGREGQRSEASEPGSLRGLERPRSPSSAGSAVTGYHP